MTVPTPMPAFAPPLSPEDVDEVLVAAAAEVEVEVEVEVGVEVEVNVVCDTVETCPAAPSTYSGTNPCGAESTKVGPFGSLQVVVPLSFPQQDHSPLVPSYSISWFFQSSVKEYHVSDSKLRPTLEDCY